MSISSSRSWRAEILEQGEEPVSPRYGLENEAVLVDKPESAQRLSEGHAAPREHVLARLLFSTTQACARYLLLSRSLTVNAG
jgi:hypothetical protein